MSVKLQNAPECSFCSGTRALAMRIVLWGGYPFQGRRLRLGEYEAAPRIAANLDVFSRGGRGGEGRKRGIGAGRGGVFGAVDASARLGATKKACGFQDAGFGEEVFWEADFRKVGFREAQPKEGVA